MGLSGMEQFNQGGSWRKYVTYLTIDDWADHLSKGAVIAEIREDGGNQGCIVGLPISAISKVE
jgi:hypothetical protein